MGLLPKDRDLTRALDRVELKVDASALGKKVEEVNERLDAFLSGHLKWRSRSSIQQLIKDGWVEVDASAPEAPEGRGVLDVEKRPGRKLKHGSRVVVIIPPELRRPEVADVSTELEVLWENEVALAVDKPAMMPVHPSGRHFSDTLIQRVHARYSEQIHESGKIPRLCHRLDKETSGIVLIAKDPAVHPLLMGQFEEREVEKEYLAVVFGEPEQEQGSIDLPLGSARASSVRLKMAVIADGLPSRTDWRVLERHGDCSLLKVKLHTGRQHQIRVHLAAIGLPIVGDKLYGIDETIFQRAIEQELTDDDRRELGMPRQALHNHRLAFSMPHGGERIEVVSPLPADMRAYLNGERW